MTLEPTIFIIFYFLLGTVIGSFLDVWTRRLLRGESPTGRSQCEYCRHVLSAADLVPLVSFFLLRGRCRYCEKTLSWQYPIVEAGTGLIFSILAVKFGVFDFNTGLLVFFLLLASVSTLIAVFITDVLAQVIAEQVLIVGALSVLLYRVFLYLTSFDPSASNFAYDILGALGVFALFWIIRIATKNKGMGDGDPPLGFVAALLVGFPNVLVQVFLTFVLGGLVAAFLLALRRKGLKDKVAFGPFVVVATFVTLLFGEHILSWYLALLGI